ncbi:MAG: hypothetical protein H7A53_10430 [Akkermansiaceae bacterium]|nr:hypothetical protein [Akkermansiaceae bacterium]
MSSDEILRVLLAAEEEGDSAVERHLNLRALRRRIDDLAGSGGARPPAGTFRRWTSLSDGRPGDRDRCPGRSFGHSACVRTPGEVGAYLDRPPPGTKRASWA